MTKTEYALRTLWKRCVSMAFFFSCGCLWQNPVFIVEESEKMNSKHRKRVPTSVFCLPCSAAASAKLLVGKCPKPSEWKGASKHGRTKKNSTNQVQSNGSRTGFNRRKNEADTHPEHGGVSAEDCHWRVYPASRPYILKFTHLNSPLHFHGITKP